MQNECNTSWIPAEEKLPEEHEIVIALYSGFWPGRSKYGVFSAQVVDDKWLQENGDQVPEHVEVFGWVPAPSLERIRSWHGEKLSVTIAKITSEL